MASNNNKTFIIKWLRARFYRMFLSSFLYRCKMATLSWWRSHGPLIFLTFPKLFQAQIRTFKHPYLHRDKLYYLEKMTGEESALVANYEATCSTGLYKLVYHHLQHLSFTIF